MSTKHYYFAGSDGSTKGPFTPHEIADLTKRGMLSRDAVVFDPKGNNTSADEIERIEDYKGIANSPGCLPPPLPTPQSLPENAP